MIAATEAPTATKRRVILPPLYPIQARIAAHPARFKVVVAGRRFGKSRLGLIVATVKALRGMRVWWVAPTYKLARIMWRDLKELVEDIPGIIIREVDKLIDFPGGGFIQVRSAHDPDSLRGDGLDFVILDEAAFMREEAFTEGVRPALSDRMGGALLLSTPNGRNWFWRAYLRGRDRKLPAWQYWHIPTAANPGIPRAELLDAELTLPQRVYQQEYLAQFHEDAGLVFRHVRQAATAPMPGRRVSNHKVIIGVDWGKSHDFTVFTAIDANTRQMIAVDRFNQIDYRVQKPRLVAFAKQWNAAALVVEENSMGIPLVEDLIAEGLPVFPFHMSAVSKTDVIERLQIAFEKGRIMIQDDPDLIGELEAYSMITTGHLRHAKYSAPAGLHDDMVISLALAWYGVVANLVLSGADEIVY